eukprot:Em0023g621a
MPTSQAAPNVTALNALTALSNPNGLLIHTCGPSSPLIPSSMSLQWNAPLQPDYVITAYTLHHRVPSLKSQSDMWGPPSTATVQFHTYNPSGILFHQINSVVTHFLGVKLHGGLPWLIFDGYVVLFEPASNTFYVTVDTVHMHRYGFDAVSVQNVGSTYIIVSWDLPTHSNGILINFSLYCNGALAGVLPLTVISYNTTGLLPFTLYMYIMLSVGQALQSRPQALHSSWNGRQQCCRQPAQVVHKEHEEPLAVSIPSHHWMENYSSLGSKFRSRLGGVTSSQDAA